VNVRKFPVVAVNCLGHAPGVSNGQATRVSSGAKAHAFGTSYPGPFEAQGKLKAGLLKDHFHPQRGFGKNKTRTLKTQGCGTRLCGDTGACPSAGERAAAGNCFDRVVGVETAWGAETAE
jgi:hypothetical protein